MSVSVVDMSAQPIGASFPRRSSGGAVTTSAAAAAVGECNQPQIASARACGRGPAPPNRARPRSASARASPRIKGLLGHGQPAAEGPETQYQAASLARARSGDLGEPPPPPPYEEPVGWASRSHFAQRPAPMA